MTNQQRSLTLAIVLTVIPITDILGANWFYLGRGKIGAAKVAVFLAYMVTGIVTGFELALLFLGIVVIWWLVDIPIIASGRFAPR